MLPDLLLALFSPTSSCMVCRWKGKRKEKIRDITGLDESRRRNWQSEQGEHDKEKREGNMHGVSYNFKHGQVQVKQPKDEQENHFLT